MDANRFDTIAKGVAGTATRRTALGTIVASGLLTALGLRDAPLAAQDQPKQPKQPDQADQPQKTCVLDFTATVRQGPSANSNARQIKGELTFTLTGKGSLDKASLRLASGASVPVLGQATGPSLQLRVQLGANQTLVAIGVGERDIADCQGAIDGVATGPATGDLGDWHATVLRSTGAVSGQAPGGAGQGGQGKQGGQGGGRRSAGGQGSQGGQTGGGGRNNSGPTGPSGPTTSETGQTAGPTAAASPSPTVPLCAESETDCSGACVDLASDAGNCGVCGHACTTDESCVGSVCQLTSSSATCTVQGLTDCNGACVDTATDAAELWRLWNRVRHRRGVRQRRLHHGGQSSPDHLR